MMGYNIFEVVNNNVLKVSEAKTIEELYTIRVPDLQENMALDYYSYVARALRENDTIIDEISKLSKKDISKVGKHLFRESVWYKYMTGFADGIKRIKDGNPKTPNCHMCMYNNNLLPGDEDNKTSEKTITIEEEEDDGTVNQVNSDITNEIV